METLGHGPLEQAEAQDREPVERHGPSSGSRLKDNGPLELGALNQESVGAPSDTIVPGARLGPMSEVS